MDPKISLQFSLRKQQFSIHKFKTKISFIILRKALILLNSKTYLKDITRNFIEKIYRNFKEAQSSTS